jgi:hypothetical protein
MLNFIGELHVYVNSYNPILDVSFSYKISSWGDGAIENGLNDFFSIYALTILMLRLQKLRS